jgi:phosphoribosyl-ATP pyrophosphohydrolase/phosphoribosyl-AMP cyclohydrolase
MILEDLEKIILARKAEREGSSYTYKLLNQENLVERKVHEEVFEVVEMALLKNRTRIIYEVGDLLYHVAVLLAKHEIPMSEIESELKRRRK